MIFFKHSLIMILITLAIEIEMAEVEHLTIRARSMD